jgi:hypothetical protein
VEIYRTETYEEDNYDDKAERLVATMLEIGVGVCVVPDLITGSPTASAQGLGEEDGSGVEGMGVRL